MADTGLDYSHDELANKVVAVPDFTTNEVQHQRRVDL